MCRSLLRWVVVRTRSLLTRTAVPFTVFLSSTPYVVLDVHHTADLSEMPQVHRTKEDNRYEYQQKLVLCLCANCKGRKVPRYTRRYHGGKKAPSADYQPPDTYEIVNLDVAAFLKKRKPKKPKVASQLSSAAKPAGEPDSESSNTQPSRNQSAMDVVQPEICADVHAADGGAARPEPPLALGTKSLSSPQLSPQEETNESSGRRRLRNVRQLVLQP